MRNLVFIQAGVVIFFGSIWGAAYLCSDMSMFDWRLFPIACTAGTLSLGGFVLVLVGAIRMGEGLK